MQENSLADRVQMLEDKMALKELVDTFSLVSDRKDNVAQASFFTENGTLISIMGETTTTFQGRKGIEEGFAAILEPLETVYHHNGQLLTTVNGHFATGYSYCLATLIGKEDGRSYIRTIWANYQDEYVKEDDRWLIGKRIATVAWEERQEINH
ncbi:nuclear transport factor 2 family protein [Mucilaginibacter sp. Bleaf8]|uniref:nuclear transport factor 2 family protein n=1 Tax=Mucilaginibacter sp. Bleaf8 TaxID=2834430 RepID=UPI001BCD61BC|nr:nuclear transport factor 2 family protein [Mucilaginibacter sp. Bleaf8]MBS7565343.1 nuclear transport factor 2 family protein [Mucilaginibacter sp. Bleaf8]